MGGNFFPGKSVHLDGLEKFPKQKKGDFWAVKPSYKSVFGMVTGPVRLVTKYT